MFVLPVDFDNDPDYMIPEYPENSFQDFIDKHEEELLRKILGHEMYEEFVLDFETNGVDYMADKYNDLYAGASYTYCEKQRKYWGLKKILIPYIYALWLKLNWKKYTRAGLTQPQSENSKNLSPRAEIVLAYTNALTLIGKCGREIDTLYGFLKANEEATYTNWTFCSPGKMNRWDL